MCWKTRPGERETDGQRARNKSQHFISPGAIGEGHCVYGEGEGLFIQKVNYIVNIRPDFPAASVARRKSVPTKTTSVVGSRPRGA
jgi:hypothetical protein